MQGVIVTSSRGAGFSESRQARPLRLRLERHIVIIRLTIASLGLLEGGNLPKGGKFVNCTTFDLSLLVNQVFRDDFTEDFGLQQVELFKELHDLLVVARVIKKLPEFLDDLDALVNTIVVVFSALLAVHIVR